MKVLHIINSLATGGAEKLLCDALPLMHQKGITVNLLLLNGVPHPFYQQLKQNKNIQIFSLGKDSVYNPIHLFRIISYLKKFDMVHVHLFPALYFVAIAKILSFSKVKLVFTEHNTMNKRMANPLFKWLDRFIYSYYDMIIGISQEVKNIIEKHARILPQKLTIINNGINIKNISLALSYSKNEIERNCFENDFLVIQVAGFRPQKDQLTLIRSMLHLPNHVKLLLVGEGETQKDCWQWVQKLGLENRVFFLGVRTDVASLLKTSDIVVLSSHYEGLSLSSIEGMASGKPFLASDVPGLREIVKGAGILFPKGDEKKLAAEIQKLMNDKTLYQSVADKCQARAKEFDIEKMVEQTVNLYLELTKK